MLPAGTDTSRTTLNWVILLMAAHPEVQEKMQKEIDDVVGMVEVNGMKPNYVHEHIIPKLLLQYIFYWIKLFHPVLP